ncbi:MAG: hypothetical protein E6X17_18260 [Sporomusaceae bacterium]|nr:hypothetical protein [Sporomusaceae bacterium]
MAMKKEQNIYHFWNGKNLNGKQEFADSSGENQVAGEFRCVEGTETVSAEELS